MIRQEMGDESIEIDEKDIWIWQLIIHPQARKMIMDETGLDPETLQTDAEKIALIDQVIDSTKFSASHQIKTDQKIKLLSGIQKWIDSSISVTYNLDSDKCSPLTIEKLYVSAWKAGLKGCTVYVQHNVGRVGIILFRKDPSTLPPEFQFNFHPTYIQKFGTPYHHVPQGE
jgi:hypothetical protein